MFVPMKFNGDVFFELLPIENPKEHSCHMYGMDKKYNGHDWCKMKTMNIKNAFNLTFWKARCLGHLQCG